MLDPPGEMHSVFMLAESETDKTRWIGALNELHKILRKNRIPNKAVSKHLEQIVTMCSSVGDSWHHKTIILPCVL